MDAGQGGGFPVGQSLADGLEDGLTSTSRVKCLYCVPEYLAARRLSESTGPVSKLCTSG